jgi:hypothetical protein
VKDQSLELYLKKQNLKRSLKEQSLERSLKEHNLESSLKEQSMEKLLKDRVWNVKNRVWRDQEQTDSERALKIESGKVTEGHSLETPMNVHILERSSKKEQSLNRSIKEQRLER